MKNTVRVSVDLDREFYFKLHGVLLLRRVSKAEFFRRLAEREIRAFEAVPVNQEATTPLRKPSK